MPAWLKKLIALIRGRPHRPLPPPSARPDLAVEDRERPQPASRGPIDWKTVSEPGAALTVRTAPLPPARRPAAPTSPPPPPAPLPPADSGGSDFAAGFGLGAILPPGPPPSYDPGPSSYDSGSSGAGDFDGGSGAAGGCDGCDG